MSTRGLFRRFWIPGGGRLRAFSLVEVTVALGIATFCLLAIVGLLPMSLSAVRNAREEAAAAAVMEQMAAAIRHASRDSNTAVFVGLSPYTNLVWTNGANPVVTDFDNLSLEGVPAQLALTRRLAARIQIAPGTNHASAGSALLSVAWPAQAQWNSASNSWKNSQGSVSTWLVFLPRP